MTAAAHRLVVHDERPETCYVTADTYPINAPYRGGGKPSGLVGLFARRMSIVFTTLVNRKSPDYDPETLTLTLGKDFLRLCKRTGMYNNGGGIKQARRTLLAYATAEFEDRNGRTVKPIASSIPASRGLLGWVIVFDRDFVRLMKRNVRRVQLDDLAMLNGMGGVAFDLFIFAVLYAPDGKNLIIRHTDLGRLLPNLAHSTVAPQAILDITSRLNENQSQWTFAYENKSVRISPRDGEADGDVRLASV